MSDKKKNSGLVAASVSLVFIVLAIIFIVRWPTFKKNFETAVKKNSSAESEETYEDSTQIDLMSSGDVTASSSEIDIDVNDRYSNRSETENYGENADAEASYENENAAASGKSDDNENNAASDGNGKSSAVSVAAESVSAQKKNATYKIYFVRVTPDGSVEKRAVSRTVEKNDSPLTAAINLLLAGPVSDDGDCETLIPEGSRLIGASVRNGIAVLNFNENFEFNRIGSEGTYGQLKQVVWTATEFSTVKSVQILIEGEQKQYLGSEGVEIGGPISRSSFGRF